MLETKQILKKIVQQNGTSVFMNINKLEELMRESGISDFKHVFLITSSLRLNIIQDLSGRSKNEDYDVLVNEIACKIENQLGLSKESCKWIIDTLAYAIDIVDYNGKKVVKAEIDEIIKPELNHINHNSNTHVNLWYWAESARKWYIAKIGDKYDLLDENHKSVMEVQYDSILKDMYCFRDSYFSPRNMGSMPRAGLIIIVKIGNKYGLVLIKFDLDGESYSINSWRYIVEPVCDSINLLNEYEGIFIVEINSKFGVINHIGQSILPTIYDYIKKLNLPGYVINIIRIGLNGKHGFATHNGEIILNPEYDKIDEFEIFGHIAKECIVKLCLNGKYGYINLNMEHIVPIIFDKVNTIKNKSGICNNGQLILVKTKDMYGVMNIYGKIIVKPRFIKILSLVLYDLWTKVKFSEDNLVKYAYVDKEGNCKLTCDLIENYQENQQYIVIKLGNKYGCILNNGEVILDTIYDEIRHIKYKNIFARVKIDNQYKLVDKKGNHIIDIQNTPNPTEDEQLEAIEYDIGFIKYIKKPIEKVQLKAIEQTPDYIKYIENPSESAQLKAIKLNVELIAYIKDPSENVKMEVVTRKPDFIQYFKNPSENIQLRAISRDANVIKYVKSPTEKVQLCAVIRQASVIEYIKNPTEEVQIIAVSFHGSYINYIKNPSKSVLEHSNVKEYYANEAAKLKSDKKYEIPEYEQGESSLLDAIYFRDYWPQ